MPSTITPTSTEPRRPHLVEDNDNGSGRRPPTDKRTGGGGDGDNYGDRSQGNHGPRERLIRYRMGIFFALASDLMFFVAIVSSFFVSQSTGHFDAYNHYINEWTPTVIPPILWLNTVVLILSSVTMEVARRRMFHEVDVMDEWLGLGKPITRRAIPWVAATVVLGTVFLIGQWIAWEQLARQHVFFLSNPSSHFFYLITGVHGLHLVLGVCVLIAALIGLYVSRSLESRQIMVDCASWYWHSMGIFWIFLFVLLVFFQ
ncbi:MAG: cytochrome c oxidase subunit 3 [Edaphobacter sp.]